MSKNKKNNGGPPTPASKWAKQRSEDSQDFRSFKTVMFYCSLIVFLPVLAFFLMRGFVLEEFFTMSDLSVNIWSAVGAVIALHIALGLYIYRAYFGNDDNKPTEKMD